MSHKMDREKRAEQFRNQMKQMNDDWNDEDELEKQQEEEYRRSRAARIQKRREELKKKHRRMLICRIGAVGIAAAVIIVTVNIGKGMFQKSGDPSSNSEAGAVSGISQKDDTNVQAAPVPEESTTQESERAQQSSEMESSDSSFKAWQSAYEATKESKVPSTTASSSKKTSSSSKEKETAATEETTAAVSASTVVMPSWIDQQLLPVNIYSRPGKSLKKVNDIVIHYVGNPNTTAQSNRNYFATLADPKVNTNGTKASSHFVVGLEGEIIQSVPLEEISYCSNQRNSDTVAIEVCHPDEAGQFNEVTYNSVVKLTAWLLEYYKLDSTNIIRHYDVTGKLCPKYYVEHEDAWEQFKADVAQYMKDNPKIQ